MTKSKFKPTGLKRVAALLLCLASLTAIAMPLTAHAEKSQQKVIRVGWYESPASYKDASGRRYGYDYVYEQKLAAYTNWTYEYVEGSWSDLMHKLMNGEIDMMGDVSYT